MAKAKKILKDIGIAAAALAGIAALRNRQFNRDFQKIEEEQRLAPLKKAVRRENAGANIPTYPKASMMKDVVPRLSQEDIEENFLVDSSGRPVASGSGEPVLRRTSDFKQVGFKKGGMVKKKEVWEKPRPASLGKSKPLAPKKKAAAKAAAKKAGRPYPNLVDNMRAARKKK